MNDNSTQNFTVPTDMMTAENCLPTDWQEACMVGRVMLPGVGPAVVFVREDGKVIDITKAYATTSDLFETENPAEEARRASFTGKPICTVEELMANSATRDASKPFLLSPADFQEIEAAGVTFVESLIERMVEESAMKEGGDVDAARARIRQEVIDIVGTEDFSQVVPGSEGALEILNRMREKGMSTLYPQVGLGPEGEVFSKAAPATAAGHGAVAGYSSEEQSWANPEPEVVLFASSKGKIVGAANGNDVNDRKKEGQSALLLHRAKVRNGSTTIGPFVRLFDDKFALPDIENIDVGLTVTRQDGSVKYQGSNNMAKISRKPADIVGAACDEEREHASGVAVFLGTMTVPLKDDKGQDFTHERGDIVRIGSDKLGYLINPMEQAKFVAPEEKGVAPLCRNLASRGLLLGEGQDKSHPRIAGGNATLWKGGPGY